MKNSRRELSVWLDEANDEELYLSAISLGEILKGITGSPGQQAPERFTGVARRYVATVV